MYKLQGKEIHKAKHLFERFTCNEPIIFSVFEGQYDGCVYVDNMSINWAVLQTPFLQHFIAGQPTNNCAQEMENIIFNAILHEQAEKEVAVFSDTDAWDAILRQIFEKHNGVTDSRKIFNFSLDNFRAVKPPTLAGVQPSLEKCKPLPFSLTDTWSAKLIIDGQVASYCNAIMVGRSKAEIDIYTEENHRGKGYGTISAYMLIDTLLKEGLTPAWSTWPFRLESQHIAQKLGFVPAPDAKAWIWMEGH